MSPPLPPAVIGAGLSGAFAALALARAGRPVDVFDGGGGAATVAGLVHPFTGHKPRPAWRFEAAMAAFEDAVADAGAGGCLAPGVLRPARDDRQAQAFQALAADHPAWAAWLPPAAARERFGAVHAPLGALWMPRGYGVDFGALVGRVLAAAEGAGAQVHRAAVSALDARPEGVQVVREDGATDGPYGRVLLCAGGGFERFPALAGLGLHRIKGQTALLERPAGLGPLPAVAGGGYVVDAPGGVVAGSSYDHDFADLAPSDAVTAQLQAKAAQMVPALGGARVLSTAVGVRVTRPGRMPLLGPVTADGRVWAFTALGSKGLLAAPLLARSLPDALVDPNLLPGELRPALR